MHERDGEFDKLLAGLVGNGGFSGKNSQSYSSKWAQRVTRSCLKFVRQRSFFFFAGHSGGCLVVCCYGSIVSGGICTLGLNAQFTVTHLYLSQLDWVSGPMSVASVWNSSSASHLFSFFFFSFFSLVLLGDRRCDILGFAPAGSVSSTSTLEIPRDASRHVWWLLCLQIYPLLGYFPWIRNVQYRISTWVFEGGYRAWSYHGYLPGWASHKTFHSLYL